MDSVASTSSSSLNKQNVIVNRYSDPCSSEREHDYENRKPDVSSAYVNFITTVIVYGNYFAMLPSTSSYADRLGETPTFGGVMLGVQNAANLGVVFLFSQWTKRSFKQPLVFASCCGIVGNLMYATAINVDSNLYALASRLVVGMNNIGVVGRRYIAVGYGCNKRTQSATFYMNCSTAGMASGSFLAALMLFAVEFKAGCFYFDGDTMPGWVYAFLWLVTLLLVVLCFEEPDYIYVSREFRKSKGSMKANANVTDMDGTHIKAKDCNLDMLRRAAAYRSPCNNLLGTILCALTIFVAKFNLGAFSASAPLVTAQLFSWSLTASALFLGAAAALSFPVVMLFKKYAKHKQDSTLLLWALFLNNAALGLLVDYGSTISEYQYTVGGLVFFTANAVSIGIAFSIFSQILVREDSLWNASLFASLSQYIGQGIGVVYGSLFYNFGGQENIVMLPNLAMLFTVNLACFIYKNKLKPERLEVGPPPSFS